MYRIYLFLLKLYLLNNMSSSKQILPSKRKAKSVSSFIMKTYDLLTHQQNYKIVRWSSNGIGFIVLNQQQFSKLILPKYFKHSNYSSFVRQLNMYNFHKIREQNGQSYFHHQFFDRDNTCRNSLAEIKRKPEKKKRKVMEVEMEEEEEGFEEGQSKGLLPVGEKQNHQQLVETPSTFSKSQSHNALPQQPQSISQQPPTPPHPTSKKFFTSTRQLFSSQFSLKFDNPPFQPSSFKKINQHQYQSFQNNNNNDDKISINDQIEEERESSGLVRFPTREFMCPSKKNILPLNLRDSGSYDMLY